MRRRFKAFLILLVVLICFCLPLLFRSGEIQLQSALAANPLNNLPAGFSDELVVGGLLTPRAFTFTPDGRILILERGSASSTNENFASIRVFKNGALLSTRAITLNVCGENERGLLGIALDPNFASNGFLYVYYTRQGPAGNVCTYQTYFNGQAGPRNRVSRLTMVGDTINPASELVLIDTIISDAGNHNAGDLQFGADGYLYITTGDSARPQYAPDTKFLNGKLLRIKPTGNGYTTAGNPFDTASGARTCGMNQSELNQGPCREIYAYGFRNPFRFSIQPGTDIPFVADVGQGTWEEIDQITAGANYGWPTREGPCNQGVQCTPPYIPSAFADPIYSYLNDGGAAVVGGPFYTGNQYPVAYWNNYFFADYQKGFVRRLIYNSSTSTWFVANFATGGFGVVDIITGPDTNLYYVRVTSNSAAESEIRRIRYDVANIAPYAQISANPVSGALGTLHTFSAAGSFDPDSDLPLSYQWDFGDGVTQTTSTPTVTHTYSAAVNRTVTLRISYSGQPIATSDPATVTVYPGNNPATATITLTNNTAPGRAKYYAGDTWGFQAANVSDPDGNAGITYAWEVVFHHRDHFHPFLPTASTTNSGQFLIPPTGEVDYVVWYRVHLVLTDARGQQTRIFQDVNPALVNLTLATDSAGGTVIFEGGTFRAPYVVTRVVGLNTTIGVESPQLIGGLSYLFGGWLHGGGQAQTIAVPPNSTQYTALLQAPNAAPRPQFTTDTTPPLSWNRISWATGYVVQIDADPLFAPLLQTSANLSINTFSYSTTTLGNGVYYWRVCGLLAGGTMGACSPANQFRVGTP